MEEIGRPSCGSMMCAFKLVVQDKLVKVTDNEVYFDGFTFERVSSKEMNVYVVIEDKGAQTGYFIFRSI